MSISCIPVILTNKSISACAMNAIRRWPCDNFNMDLWCAVLPVREWEPSKKCK